MKRIILVILLLLFSIADLRAEVTSPDNVPINGACGSSSGMTFSRAPTDNLCTSGTASPVYGDDLWIWNCEGANGGITYFCTAQYPQNPIAELYSMENPNWQQTNGPYGGDIKALVIDPSVSQTLYAATSGGGIFKSFNGGESWGEINTGLTDKYVWSLAIDPTTPQTIYAGTYLGGGVFKSTNGGESWSAVNAGLIGYAPGGDPYTTQILSLVIDPKTPQTIYAVTASSGVFKSDNGGASWRLFNTGINYHGVISLAIDPINSQTVYAGTYGGVFKTVNGGLNWTEANSGLTKINVQALAIDLSTPQTLYAGINDGSIFKSVNGGTSWSAVKASLPNAFEISLVIDPTTPQTIYAGIYGNGVYKSINGGESWSAVNTGLTSLSVYSLAIDATASQTLYVGTYVSGIFKTVNGGLSWHDFSTGLMSTYITYLAIDPSTPQTVYALISDGGISKTSNGGASWNPLNNGITNKSVSSIAISPSAPLTLYAGTYAGVFKSVNGGESWTKKDNSSEIKCLAIAPTDTSTIYAGSYYSGVIKSVDGGETWKTTNSGLPGSYGRYNISALAIDPTSPQTIYIGLDDYGLYSYGVYKSVNGGTTWSAVNSGLYGNGSKKINAIAIDPTTPQTVYIGTEDGLYKSTNGGAYWSKVYGETMTVTPVEGVNVYSLAIDPSSAQTLYAGTYGGVLMSVNGGSSWNSINLGLTRKYVLALAIDPTSPQKIYAGTNGGVFTTAFIPPINAKCGESNGVTYPYNTISALNLCTAGTATFVTGSDFMSWSCKGISGGVSVNCSAARYLEPPVNGFCGTSSGQSLSSAPDANLCTTGVVSSVNGTGPWSWSCNGNNGGETSYCFSLKENAMPSELSWRQAGVLSSGVIQSLVIDPTTPQTIYIGTDDGGVFKSVNAGSSWIAANIGLTDKFVTSLAIDPTSSQTLYAGSIYGDVFKSVDSGMNWHAVRTVKVLNTGTVVISSPSVRSIVIDPTSPTTIYLGVTGGVYKSINGGASWNLMNTGLTDAFVLPLVIDPSNTQTLYAGTGGRVLKSINGGASWNSVNTVLINKHVHSLVLDPANPLQSMPEYMAVESISR